MTKWVDGRSISLVNDTVTRWTFCANEHSSNLQTVRKGIRGVLPGKVGMMVGMLNNYEGKYRPVIGNRGTSKSLNGDERGGLGRIGDIAIIKYTEVESPIPDGSQRGAFRFE